MNHKHGIMKRAADALSKALVLTLLILGYAHIAASGGEEAAAVSALTADEGVKIPVIMYHSLLKDAEYHGKYVISPDLLEADLAYLKDNGYTTVLIDDLIAYTKGGELPEKPIMLTFDDGYYNNYLYGFPLLRKYNSKAVISVIGFYSELYTEADEYSAYYSHLTWEQLSEMNESGLVEIGNHTYNLHSEKNGKRGVAMLSNESSGEYGKRIAEDITKMQRLLFEKTGIEARLFTYPFGIVPEVSKELIKSLGFSASLSCEEHISRVTRDPASLYLIGRYLRPSGISSEDYFKKILG